jgi:hypothetical protein
MSINLAGFKRMQSAVTLWPLSELLSSRSCPHFYAKQKDIKNLD